MPRERGVGGPTFNDFIAQELIREGNWDGLQQFLEQRARFLPELYTDGQNRNELVLQQELPPAATDATHADEETVPPLHTEIVVNSSVNQLRAEESEMTAREKHYNYF